MQNAFQKDVDALNSLATVTDNLAAFMPALGAMLSQNSAALASVTNAYRIVGADTGYSYAFALRAGVFSQLTPSDHVDVTVTGKEANLMAIFRRTLNPAAALLLQKVKVEGSKPALLKLAAML